MSYTHRLHVQPLEHRTPFQLLRAHAQSQPNKEAVVFRDATTSRRAITFKEYEEKSEALAAALLELGLVRGDRVFLMLPNSEEFLFIHMALNMIGALVVVGEQDAYPTICDIEDLACIIASIAYNVSPNINYELRNILQEGALKAGIIVGRSAVGDDLLNSPIVYAYDKLFEMANEESSTKVKKAEAQVQFDDPTIVLFTSGSTGIPKPIQFTNQAFVSGAWVNAYNMALEKDTILFSDGPFDWITGMGCGIAVVVLLGCTLVSFPPRLAFNGGFTATIMKVLEEEKCTNADLLLYFLQDMLSCEEVHSTDLSNLKYFTTGSQPISITLLEKICNMLPQVVIRDIYGSTEGSSLATQEITRNSINFMEFGLMQISPGLEVKIIDEDGRVVPVNTPGEMCVRANWVSFMVHGLTKSSFTEPDSPQDVSLGWHHTKDLATLTAKGEIKLIGRMDNLIKCASESIQPIEIEDVLMTHPDIENVIVVGVPDERLYQKICACIVIKNGHYDNAEELRANFEEWYKGKFFECSNGLALKPHYFVFLKRLPLTRSGKFNRKVLIESATKELGLLD